MKKILMMGAALLVMQAVPALAQEHGPMHEGGKHGGPGEFFEMQDANKDGVVSEDEFLAKAKEKFSMIDTDKDGKITKEELEARHAEMKKKFEERRGDRKDKSAPDAE